MVNLGIYAIWVVNVGIYVYAIRGSYGNNTPVSLKQNLENENPHVQTWTGKKCIWSEGDLESNQENKTYAP